MNSRDYSPAYLRTLHTVYALALIVIWWTA